MDNPTEVKAGDIRASGHMVYMVYRTIDDSLGAIWFTSASSVKELKDTKPLLEAGYSLKEMRNHKLLLRGHEAFFTIERTLQKEFNLNG